MAFTNSNICQSFNQVIGTGLTMLSSYVCSQATIFNSGPNSVYVYDNGLSATQYGFVVPVSGTFVFNGVTDSSQLSAASPAGASTIYCRTQYFSSYVIAKCH